MARIYLLRKGESVTESIQRIAKTGNIQTAQITGIGAVGQARIAYYNHDSKQYEVHDYDEHMEVTSMTANVTLSDGKPFLHLHVNLGRRDMSVIGRHLMSAIADPFLEIVITETGNRAIRRYDTDLNLTPISEIEG